ALRDPGGSDLAEVLGRDDLEWKTVVDRRHQLAILRHHPISSWVHRHGGADDRSLLTHSRGVEPELALPLECDYALVVSARLTHPPQRLEEELFLHSRLHTSDACPVGSQHRG